MTYDNEPQSRQMRKAHAARAAKRLIAEMTVMGLDGERRPLRSPTAAKVIERGTRQLFLRGGEPFAMQISHKEAAAFFTEDVDRESRFAIAFAINGNCQPYCTLPVEAFRAADHDGPAPSARALVEKAEQLAFRSLFNEAMGLWPHMLARDPGADA